MDTHFLSEYMKLLIPETNCNLEENIRVHECSLRESEKMLRLLHL